MDSSPVSLVAANKVSPINTSTSGMQIDAIFFCSDLIISTTVYGSLDLLTFFLYSWRVAKGVCI